MKRFFFEAYNYAYYIYGSLLVSTPILKVHRSSTTLVLIWLWLAVFVKNILHSFILINLVSHHQDIIDGLHDVARLALPGQNQTRPISSELPLPSLKRFRSLYNISNDPLDSIIQIIEAQSQSDGATAARPSRVRLDPSSPEIRIVNEFMCRSSEAQYRPVNPRLVCGQETSFQLVAGFRFKTAKFEVVDRNGLPLSVLIRRFYQSTMESGIFWCWIYGVRSTSKCY